MLADLAQQMSVHHPGAILARVVGDGTLHQLERLATAGDQAQHLCLQRQVVEVLRVGGQQPLDVRQCLIVAMQSVQKLRQLEARGREPGSVLEAFT